MFGPVFVVKYFVFVLLCKHLEGKERACCFSFTVFLMSCETQCSVALPHGPVGWSAVCSCGIF